MTLPHTQDWQKYQTTVVPNVRVESTAGVLRIVFDTGGVNLNCARVGAHMEGCATGRSTEKKRTSIVAGRVLKSAETGCDAASPPIARGQLRKSVYAAPLREMRESTGQALKMWLSDVGPERTRRHGFRFRRSRRWIVAARRGARKSDA